jgi:hypothetical protein
MEGILNKMETELINGEAKYKLVLESGKIDMNSLVGKKIKLSFAGEIFCTECGKKTKKSYGGGYCYPCTIKLPECDMCILKPELCHFDNGTCRDAAWGEKNCMIDHYIYLANSSGAKVGITRMTQTPYRFIDQGAVEALPIMKVKKRYYSGLIEILLATHIKDKTDWRKMLKGEIVDLDLYELRDEIFETFENDLMEIESKMNGDEIEFLNNSELIQIKYPVLRYPNKVTSFNLDKLSEIEGVLEGIKGQYLIFDSGVINIRNHTGYKIKMEIK